jgi:hypothetical protein
VRCPCSPKTHTDPSTDAQVLCKVVSDLSTIHDSRFKLKNRHWWSIGKPYRRCNYDIRVVIGPADVNFELWFEGAKLSRDNPITVQWQASAAPPPVNDMDGEARDLPAITHARRVGAAAAANAANAAAAAAAARGQGRPTEDPSAGRVHSMTGGPPPPHYFNPNGNAYQ